MTPEPTLPTLFTAEAPLEFAALATLWPVMLAFLVVLGIVLLVQRRHQ